MLVAVPVVFAVPEETASSQSSRDQPEETASSQSSRDQPEETASSQSSRDQPDDTDRKVEFSDEDILFFESKVKPILKESCLECHGSDPDDIGGGLAIVSRLSILEGGDSGPAVDLDDAGESVLLDAINFGDYEMPPSGKLPQDQIDTLKKWIDLGMPWTAKDADKLLVSNHSSVPQVNDETKLFWSFQPVKPVQIPIVKDSDWAKNNIDSFVLSRLKKAGLEPAQAASRHDLIRRATYDLTGLPPSPSDVGDFIDDSSPDAYVRLVNRLLESPHYGEKWGRHWLDLVRYAESNGFERDGAKPFVWRYRDYVIRAFNDDKPYDQFLAEQLAGDELDNPTNDSIIATGYYRLGQWDDEPADPIQAEFDDFDDIIATTSQAMMGITVNCARCHDHKIDPIPQSDYYRMLAFFRNVKKYGIRSHETVVENSTTRLKKSVPAAAEELEQHRTTLAAVKRKRQDILDLVIKDFSNAEHEDFEFIENHEQLVRKRAKSGVITKVQLEQYLEHQREATTLTKNRPGEFSVLCVKESGASPPATHVLVRGNASVEGEEVQPGFVSVLSPPEPSIIPRSDTSGRRRSLAKWITSPSHPLTARVMVNRIWQHHFGKGIVASPNDFGFQGDKPTHPFLIDYLASRFVASGWSIKAMHRQIMLSSTYQMSNTFDQNAFDVDPTNQLLWRFDMRRLTAEEIRDSMLAVNGRLNTAKMFGPSVYIQLSQEVLDGQSRPGEGWGNSSDEDRRRRSIYIHAKRSLRPPMLANFDSADTDASCPVRFNTTQPTQALGLLNSKFSHQEAHEFAILIARTDSTLQEQIIEINQRIIQGEPRLEDVNEAIDLVEQWKTEDGLSHEQALTNYCLLAFNSNEFIFLK